MNIGIILLKILIGLGCILIPFLAVGITFLITLVLFKIAEYMDERKDYKIQLKRFKQDMDELIKKQNSLNK